MARRVLRFLLTSGLLLALALLARRTMHLRGATIKLVPSPDPWPPIPEARPEPAEPVEPADQLTAPQAPEPTDQFEPAPPEPSEPSEPSGQLEPTELAAAAPPWVVAHADGSCPATHPIKAKAASGIYHLPGMANYQRTKPDRCYAEEVAAEADGFTRAKR